MKIRQLFGIKSHKKSVSVTPSQSPEGPPTIEDGSPNALRRQLVQVLLRDLVRRHGIPADWLDCQMLLVSSRSRGEGMYLRIILKHWDLRMLAYAVAFEKALMHDILRFEPHAKEWLYGVSWQLETGRSCPHQELPDPSVWAEKPQHGNSQNDLKQDLERIFAVRDADMLLRGEASAPHARGAYATTEPMPLRKR